MILALGSLFSIYQIFLCLPGAQDSSVSKLKNQFLSRVTLLVQGVYLAFIIDSSYHWVGDVVFLDGLVLVSNTILTGEIYLILLVIAIVHLQGLFENRPEIYQIIGSNLTGLIYLISSADWIVTVTAWELFNLSLYLLTAMTPATRANGGAAALSAAIKYFLLSAVTTTLLLLGVAFLYAQTGSTHYDSISMQLAMGDNQSGLILGAWVGIIVTFLFKLSAAPFHLVGPDIYDGVPTTTTTWMIHIPKFAVILLLIQLEPLWGCDSETAFFQVQAGLASIIVGSIGLGSQFRIKRFQAYSSISHVGFMLQCLATGSSAAGFYYQVIYLLTSLSIFALLLGIGQAIGREVTLISQLSGLFSLNPGAALAQGFSLFGLAGVPPIAGFFGKLLALQSFLSQGWYWVSIQAVLVSVISAAYYLYLIKVTHFDRPAAPAAVSRIGVGLALPASVTTTIALQSTFNVLFLMSPASFIGLASAAYF